MILCFQQFSSTTFNPLSYSPSSNGCVHFHLLWSSSLICFSTEHRKSCLQVLQAPDLAASFLVLDRLPVFCFEDTRISLMFWYVFAEGQFFFYKITPVRDCWSLFKKKHFKSNCLKFLRDSYKKNRKKIFFSKKVCPSLH